MPDNTLQQALKEAYASAPTDIVIHHTLEFSHDQLPEPARVVRDIPPGDTLTATLETGAVVTFQGLPFEINLPNIENTPVPELRIALDNTPKPLLQALENAVTVHTHPTNPWLSPVRVTYRPFLSNDLSTPHMIPPLTLILGAVEITATRVLASARMADISRRSFPRRLYSAEDFPDIAL